MWLLSPIVCFLAAVLLHAVMRRVVFRAGAVSLFFAVGAAMGLGLMFFLYWYYGRITPSAITGVCSYAALCELYVFLFTMVLSSVSANLLVRLDASASSAAVLDEVFDGEAMVKRRIDRMITAGFLRQQDDQLYLTGKGDRLLRFLNSLRKFFRHPEGTYLPSRNMSQGATTQDA